MIIKRILALFAVCTLITAVSACYTSALVFLSSENTEANNKLDSLLKDDIYTEDSREFYTELREEMLMNILDELTLVIENSEALRTDESLKEINDLFEKCESITIYDSNGRSEASSLGYTGYVLGIGEAESNGNKVISVLESDSPSILIDADGDEGDLDYYATKCRFNSGFILYAVHDNEFQDIIDRLNEAVLITEEDFGNSDLLYYDQNNSSKLYVSYAGTGDLVTVENKLTAGQLSDNYFGTCSVAGHKYYINVRADFNHEGNYYISAGQLGDIVQSIATVGVFFVLSIAVLLLLEICLFAPFSLDHRSIISIESKEEEDDEGDGRAAHIKINERKQRRKNAEEEGPLRLKKEGKLNELYELGNDLMTRDFSGYIGMLSKGCIVIFLVFLVFELLTENDTGFLVRYLFNTEWERGFNLFSITLVIITISIVWPVSILLQRIVLIISNNTGSAGLTIGKMVISLIKFASLVIIIILSLKEFGVETIQIMAGAGVTSVIFGIGAQSTIGDILSGLFIIFEGYFHVGDIVEFDDWNGVIKEIGVRSTCLESFGHADDFRNIRVINNSDFKDVINLSVCLSKAAIVLRIPFDVDINEVRRVYETKVDEIRAAVPSMIDGPFWGGVSGYGDGGKEVIIVAKCYQKDKRKVEFRMRQIVGEAFEREGFGVPHPNWYVADPKKEQTKLQSAEPDKVHDIYD